MTRSEQSNNDYRVVVFGAGGVGKSSLVLRFIKGTFRESYIPTIEDTYRQVSYHNSFDIESIAEHRIHAVHQKYCLKTFDEVVWQAYALFLTIVKI